ncbi:PDGLE domain-containing protein [Desulforamulus ruminis]|uniref:PDGLE domain-containing protein n=1 Tax=Desulforamulus ruminis (strain ATCC 23193 / DSM 2154 / NCIMB 8452 / DL) TaxID=696281 RepID=F6DKL0_DESRL|nr:PDGLE domain-containing protein [Desulforamulus ruminis]AEG59270.1 hypothetical protein Desru_0995 [Desulforamulus ruminis DSM 2154]
MNKKLCYGLLISLLVASFLSPWASPHPDGLEKVAEELHFLVNAEGKEVLNSPIPDYIMPGIGDESVATGAAGIVGTLLTFGLIVGLRRLLVKKETHPAADAMGNREAHEGR